MLRVPTFPLRLGLIFSLVICVLYISGYNLNYIKTLPPTPLNSTLGFGAIILISLPERTDRRDAISLITSVSDISITHTVDAVKGEDISQKARPGGKAISLNLAEAHWGSWRSHLNALKYIVDNRIETAIIWEDDVDWDPNIKEQMHAFAQAIPLSSENDRRNYRRTRQYPYGKDWDIIHMGVSRVSAPPNPSNVRIYHDTSLPTGPYRDTDCHGNWFCYSKYLQAIQAPEQSRSIASSYEPIGLLALAVTFKGAQKLLYLLSWSGLDTGLDESIRNAIRDGDLFGFTVIPPLFGSWTTSTSTDSDIRADGRNKAPDNLKSHARGIKSSVRQTLKYLIISDQKAPPRKK